MEQFIVFIKKEFAHVLRDRKTLLILFGMPVVQILIFGFALTNEVKNSRIAVIDYAKDESSTQIIDRIEASRYFEIDKIISDHRQISPLFREGRIKLAIVFPAKFQRDLLRENRAQLQIIADASDPNTATTLVNYVSAIVNEHQRGFGQQMEMPYQITVETRMLYNPQLKGVHNFVPGVMALVLMLVCVMMTAISIVREKESGTMEILLVSPFKPVLVILSKAIPYLVLSLFNIGTILLISVFVLELPIHGSILLLLAESTLFIVTCLTLGIFISIKTSSQQVAMLISLMGMLLPAVLFSGFMFPIENMPWVFQLISNILPSKWFYIIVKSIMIKGLGFEAIWKETLVLIAITLFFLFVSIRNFTIRLT
jgi:ABC-2 type transport system permease protein